MILSAEPNEAEWLAELGLDEAVVQRRKAELALKRKNLSSGAATQREVRLPPVSRVHESQMVNAGIIFGRIRDLVSAQCLQ